MKKLITFLFVSLIMTTKLLAATILVTSSGGATTGFVSGSATKYTLAYAFTSSSSGDILELDAGTYSSVGTLALTKSLTFKASASAATKPILVAAIFTLNTTNVSFELNGLECYYDVPGVVTPSASRYFITATTASTTFPSLKIQNCFIHGYGRALLRSDSNGAIFTTITINNCFIYDMGRENPSYSIIAASSALISAATITNSTIYSCDNGFWYSAITTTPITFSMTNCSIIKTTSTSKGIPTVTASKKMFNFSANPSSTYTFTDCLISDSQDATTTNMVMQLSSNNSTIMGYLYNTVIGNNFSSITGTLTTDTRLTPTALSIATPSTISFSDSQYKINTTPNTYRNIGDARWTLNPTVLNSPTTSLSGFSCNYGTVASTSQNFTVSAVALRSVVTISATSTDYELSTDNINFSSTLSLGTVGSDLGTTTIYVRLKANLPIGNYNNEAITISATGVTPNKTVTCSGSVLSGHTVLSTPTSLTTTARATDGFSISWGSVSNATSYTVKLYQSDGTTEITGSSQPGLTGTTTSFTGLSSGTNYKYTVTAIGDGTTYDNSVESSKASVITVNIAKAITAFSITGQVSSTITGTNIVVIVPYGTTITSLTPSITQTGVSVSPTGAQDFSSPVQYTVTAEDGSTQVYTATVTLGSSTTDNFRSKADGDWNDATPGNVWESSADNSTWYPATSTPGISAASITIKSSNTVTVAANTTIGTTTIETSGTLKTTGTAVVTVGASKTLTVNGIFENYGTVPDLAFSAATAVNFNSGSTYLLSGANMFIPGGTSIISWDLNSTVNITGGIGGSWNTTAGTVYGNVVFNSTTLTGSAVVFSTGSPMQRIAGNLTVSNLGTAALQLISSGGTNIIALDGDYLQSAGTVILNPSSYAATTFRPFVVKGNFTLNGGTFTIASGTANCYLIVKGDLLINNSATFQSTAGAGSGTAYVHLAGASATFTRSATSTISSTNNPLNFVVNSGSTVNMGTSVINGTNVNFTTSAAYTAPSIIGSTTINTYLITVTNSADFTGIQPGMAISGGSIPANTYVTAVYSTTQLQISKATTATATGVTFTVSPASSNSSQVTGGVIGSVKDLTLNGTNSATLSNSLTTTTNLTAGAGATLNVPAGKQLTVSSSFVNNGTINLASDATGTATILTPATITGSGTSTVQQYLTTGRNWYVSCPVTSSASSVLSLGTSVVSYNEANATWGTQTTLTPGIGYISVATTGTAAPVTFSGTLNNGNIPPVALTRTTGQTKEGFNLVGNPYPSYLVWSEATATAANTLTTIWYRTKDAGVYTFYTYNPVTDLAAPSTAGITAYIPPMQAFWVRVNAGGGTLQFTNAMRAHADAGTNLLKAKSSTRSTQQVLRLQVSNGTNSDEAIVVFNPNASNSLDNYDSPKMSNANALVPEIFTTVDASEMVINGLNSTETVSVLPLGFRTGETNNFMIKATQTSNFASDMRIILKDNVLKTEQDITDGTAYSFSSSATNSTTRFAVVFKSGAVATSVENKALSNLAIYRNANNQICVSTPDRLIGNSSVIVFNVIGQLVQNVPVQSTNIALSNIASGVYVVVFKSDAGTVSRKIVIE